MLNIAFASANIPEDASMEDAAKYAAIMNYIKDQYHMVSGRELVIPGSPKDFFKAIRRIVFDLPKAEPRSIDQIDEFNKLAISALIAA
jgi:hypothetical protein